MKPMLALFAVSFVAGLGYSRWSIWLVALLTGAALVVVTVLWKGDGYM